ncbi:DUF4158 domain-containing protein [Streptomyces sp. NPDC013157]|uniref:DUF4158 domain-containing protein n=1 Tax=Streptomyces sp. NPDC013157 TaxID=3364861 RepID=UPI0036C400DA
MTSIERTAYPRFKRLITAGELHVFFTPSEEERAWIEEVTDSDEHQLALLVALKSYQRMGCFPKAHDVPDQVVEFVRRAVELPESTLSVYASGRTAERYRSWVRERCGVRYDGQAARRLAEETMRVAAASKNNPADLINVALEKLVEANLEIPRVPGSVQWPRTCPLAPPVSGLAGFLGLHPRCRLRVTLTSMPGRLGRPFQGPRSGRLPLVDVVAQGQKQRRGVVRGRGEVGHGKVDLLFAASPRALAGEGQHDIRRVPERPRPRAGEKGLVLNDEGTVGVAEKLPPVRLACRHRPVSEHVGEVSFDLRDDVLQTARTVDHHDPPPELPHSATITWPRCW